MLKGKVYKLSAPNCDKIYIGSTYCKYASVRLAHHRQYHRNKWKDYQGLFDNGVGELPRGMDSRNVASCHRNRLSRDKEYSSLIMDNPFN